MMGYVSCQKSRCLPTVDRKMARPDFGQPRVQSVVKAVRPSDRRLVLLASDFWLPQKPAKRSHLDETDDEEEDDEELRQIPVSRRFQ